MGFLQFILYNYTYFSLLGAKVFLCIKLFSLHFYINYVGQSVNTISILLQIRYSCENFVNAFSDNLTNLFIYFIFSF